MSQDERVPANPKDDEGAREYGRHLAMDGLLEWALGSSKGAAQRPARRFRFGYVAAAALLILGVSGYFFFGVYRSRPEALARVEKTQGTVYLITGEGKKPLGGTEEVLPHQGIQTVGPGSRVEIVYPDGTRLGLGPDTAVEAIEEGAAGKRLSVIRGSLSARVAKQPAGLPMVFMTPHGEATVRGTTLRLIVDPDPKKGARLDVEEGKVEFKNLAKKAVLVESGHYAVAGVGLELVTKALPSKSDPSSSLRGADRTRLMAPGTWISVPGSHLRSVAPSPAPPGGNGPSSVIDSWSGAAYDPTRDRLLVWGGGNSNYGGNEIYSFDLNAFAWSRIWGPSAGIPEPGRILAATETYADGTPVSRGTYGGLEYVPFLDALWAAGGGRYSSGSATSATWAFNEKASKWSRRADAPKLGYGNVAAYDPVTKHVFLYAQTDLLEYDPAGDTWSSRYSGPWRANDLSGAIDPGRRKFILIGGGAALLWEISASGPMKVSPLATTGAKEIERASAPGFVYDPRSDVFVAWNGGADVYTLDPVSWVWTRVTPAASNSVVPPRASPHGTFGRFRYVPSQNVFIAVSSIDEDVHLYKLR